MRPSLHAHAQAHRHGPCLSVRLGVQLGQVVSVYGAKDLQELAPVSAVQAPAGHGEEGLQGGAGVTPRRGAVQEAGEVGPGARQASLVAQLPVCWCRVRLHERAQEAAHAGGAAQERVRGFKAGAAVVAGGRGIA